MSQIISTRNAIWRRSSFRLVTGSVTAIVLALNLGVQNAFPQSPPSVVSANLTAAKPAGLARNLTTTNPTATSAASIYASNWQNKIAIWNASKLNQNDTGAYGPRIAELRSSSAWSTNQIVDYSGFFQDTTDSVKYDQIHNFDSSAYLDENGALNSTYGKYSATTLPITIKLSTGRCWIRFTSTTRCQPTMFPPVMTQPATHFLAT
jgi:hypothetical protein